MMAIITDGKVWNLESQNENDWAHKTAYPQATYADE